MLGLLSDSKKGNDSGPIIQGPGVKSGSIGSDWEHAVGVERLELLGKLAGKPIFSSTEPLRHDKGLDFKGTLAEPLLVESLARPADPIALKERIVGCSGVPRGSHEIGYFWVRSEFEATRCPECGQAFKLNLLMS